jgi:hypothetical protein
MKRIHILYRILILLLILLDIFLLVDRNRLKRNALPGTETTTNSDNVYITERLNDNIRISKPSGLISIDGDSLIGRSNKGKRRIIFRYTITNCHDCVTSEFEAIQQVLSENPLLGDRLCIMTFYNNNSVMADDLRELRNRKVNIPIFICQHLNTVPLEEENLPYYFVLENDSIIRNVFICHHAKPNLTKAYLNSAYEFCKE